MEINTVVRMIQELTKKTVSNGCTEGEALAAAEKIGELLTVYNISMDEVFLGKENCVTERLDTGRKARHPIDICMVGLAAFCDCKVWKERGKTMVYCFFGLKTDIEMAKYLYRVVRQAMDTELAKFKRSAQYVLADVHRKRLSVSFQKGMANRIYHRLVEMKKERQREEDRLVPTGVGTGTSIVVIKRNKIDDEFEKLSLRLRKSPGSNRRVHGAAYDAGKQAGDKINLNRPIHGNVGGYLK